MPITTAAEAALLTSAARPPQANVNAQPVVRLAGLVLSRVEAHIEERLEVRKINGRNVPNHPGIAHNRRRWIPLIVDPFDGLTMADGSGPPDEVLWLVRERLVIAGFRFGTVDTENGPRTALLWGAA